MAFDLLLYGSMAMMTTSSVGFVSIITKAAVMRNVKPIYERGSGIGFSYQAVGMGSLFT